MAVAINIYDKGGSLNHVDDFWDFLDPPLPPMWIILLNKGYVLMWIFQEPPPPPLVIHMVYGCSLSVVLKLTFFNSFAKY